MTYLIIIKPENGASFFASTVAVYKLIKNSIIGEAGIAECTRNISKKVYALKLSSTANIQEILALQKLGEYKVKCYKPLSNTHKIGVIGPIGKETKAEELEEEMKENGYPGIKVQRLMKGYGAKSEQTTLMKITMKVEKLPEKINIMNELFTVRAYVEKPWQCYNCQGFGHNARDCRNKVKCVVCAGFHRYEVCPNKAIEMRVCANCKGSHTASYGGCPYIQKERKIQEIRAKDDSSYREALLVHRESETINRTQILEGNNRRGVIDPINNARSRMNQTSTSVTKATSSRAKAEVGTQTDTVVGTQTDTATEMLVEESMIENIEKTLTKHLTENFITDKLAACLMEIICGMGNADTLRKKCAIVTNAFDTHCAKKISVNILHNEISKRIDKEGRYVGVGAKDIKRSKSSNGSRRQ